MREVWIWMKTRSLGENQQAGPLCIPCRMVDSKLKYILGCCFGRADVKGEHLRAHCFIATPQKLRPSGPLNTDLSLVHKYRCRTSSLGVGPYFAVKGLNFFRYFAGKGAKFRENFAEISKFR